MTTVTTAVPDLQFSDNGVLSPDLSQIVDGVLSDLDSALGGGMQKDLRTPQGQIATSEAAIIAQNNDRWIALVNQLNPDYSSGRIQDAIGKIYFLERSPGKGTVVSVKITGLPNTYIQSGSLIQDNNGYKYTLLTNVTIPSSGEYTADFQNIEFGPIPCPIGSMNTIISPIPGWSDVQNLTVGVLGNLVESRSAFEVRRRESVAINARDVVDSIQASVAAVDGVVDYYVWDNYTDQTVNKGSTNVPVLPHSVYICVSGGNSSDVANAIWKSKSGGCNTNGNVSVIVYDKNYEQPYPQYTINYQEAAQTNVYVKVELQNNPQLPGDITSQVKNAVIKAFAGQDGGIKARIGAYVNSGRFIGGVYNIDPQNVNIISIQVSLDNTNWSSFVELGIDQIPIISDNNITVTLI